MSLSKNKIKYVQSLKDKKFREEHNTFVVEGDKMVAELLPAMKCQLLIATPDFIQTNFIRPDNIEEIIEVSKSELSRASFLKNPQQALAVFYQPHYALDSHQLKDQLSLALDCIQDPGNMGTIIRLADWYGIENIICSLDTVDVYNPKVVQATMGALARVKVHYMDLYSYLKNIEEIPLYGTFLDGRNMYEQELAQTGIIVMGNEGNGISPQIETLITNKLFIPNYPQDRETSESLNVAIATAIICTEFRRRLQKQ
ncbi:TrmH family RNA methyltransferase [Dysgonomonas alginatilytica]|uniref:TrmH family RNA methyltransferase n=1 Tax=Dysgonomonas alginatilytica TaxID=1605892 RepID=A0A2V3PWJ2_9BACT|nr:RNA methyltransferase [Dysgonomonas alginatilytica]PXV64707.1 TrmH family RNA methyltransferase [Dysgonomonas alginatilytica]